MLRVKPCEKLAGFMNEVCGILTLDTINSACDLCPTIFTHCRKSTSTSMHEKITLKLVISNLSWSYLWVLWTIRHYLDGHQEFLALMSVTVNRGGLLHGLVPVQSVSGHAFVYFTIRLKTQRPHPAGAGVHVVSAGKWWLSRYLFRNHQQLHPSVVQLKCKIVMRKVHLSRNMCLVIVVLSVHHIPSKGKNKPTKICIEHWDWLIFVQCYCLPKI